MRGNPSLRFDISAKFTVDTQKAEKAKRKIKGKEHLDWLERAYLEFSIHEMEAFKFCSFSVLKQYNLMNSKELEEFVSKCMKKGIFKSIIK
jgi:hypothetical protein